MCGEYDRFDIAPQYVRGRDGKWRTAADAYPSLFNRDEPAEIVMLPVDEDGMPV